VAGECHIRCGAQPPRRWEEGKVLLFDDSFEHEVWNETDLPRLVLIMDIWHPGLNTEKKRLGALEHEHDKQVWEA
jgi:aspartate beta-hydroxylase